MRGQCETTALRQQDERAAWGSNEWRSSEAVPWGSNEWRSNEEAPWGSNECGSNKEVMSHPMQHLEEHFMQHNPRTRSYIHTFKKAVHLYESYMELYIELYGSTIVCLTNLRRSCPSVTTAAACSSVSTSSSVSTRMCLFSRPSKRRQFPLVSHLSKSNS